MDGCADGPLTRVAVIDKLQQTPLRDVAEELEISKAIHLLKEKNVDAAKKSLGEIEKRDDEERDPATRSRAATNLCFMSLLQEDIKEAVR